MEIVVAAITQNMCALQFASNELKNNKTFMLKVINLDALSLKENVQKDKNCTNDHNIRHVDDNGDNIDDFMKKKLSEYLTL